MPKSRYRKLPKQLNAAVKLFGKTLHLAISQILLWTIMPPTYLLLMLFRMLLRQEKDVLGKKVNPGTSSYWQAVQESTDREKQF